MSARTSRGRRVAWLVEGTVTVAGVLVAAAVLVPTVRAVQDGRWATAAAGGAVGLVAVVVAAGLGITRRRRWAPRTPQAPSWHPASMPSSQHSSQVPAQGASRHGRKQVA